VAARAADPAATWPSPEVRAVFDVLDEGVLALSGAGRVLYANPAAGTLLGSGPERLLETTGAELLADGVEQLGAGRAGSKGASGPLVLDWVTGDGGRVRLEATVNPLGDGLPVVVVLRHPAGQEQLSRWASLTKLLFDRMAGLPAGAHAAEGVLEVLGTELGWETVSLWALEPGGRLVRQHVWTDPRADPAGVLRERARPESGTTLPPHVLQSGEPLWVPDLREDERFADGPAAAAGLVSAVVFPVRSGDSIVGVVELLGARRHLSEPEVSDLVGAAGRPIGELLSAILRTAEREQLLRDVERARRIQDFLLRASRVLAEAADYGETLDRLAEVAVPDLADLCLIDVVDESGLLRRMAARHVDPAKRELARELRDAFPPDPDGLHPIVEVVRGGGSRWSAEMSDDFLRATTRGERHFQVVKALGFESYVIVPLVVDGEVLGSVTLVSAGSGRRFGSEDVVSAEQLASQVASVVGRARRHERDHVAALTLQRSLLPGRLPDLAGLQLAARYLPAADYNRVGGDWYDVVSLEGKAALVVGDIEGHDLEAAVEMGRLRHALATILLETSDPAEALTRLDRVAAASSTERMATIVVAVLDLTSGELEVASAGHPLPILTDKGIAAAIEVPVDPPIGILTTRHDRRSLRARFEGGLLVMFTDGLVEHRAVDWDVSFRRLVSVVESSPQKDAEGTADHILSGMLGHVEGTDDVALLVAAR